MNLMPEPPIAIICSRWRGQDVKRDAFATWNPELQMWGVCAIRGGEHCEGCDDAVSLEETPY